MNIEIIEQPLQFHLHGFRSSVDNGRFAEVGVQLMNQMWQVVKAGGVPTVGINHWVYLADGSMFVGVQLRDTRLAPDTLEPLSFALQRYMKHSHVGPYQSLPEKWKALKAELIARGEVIGSPSLEIYGHHCDEPSKLETAILIGLAATHSPTTDSPITT